MSRTTRLLRWFALWWNGKSFEQFGADYSWIYFETRSHVKAYCLAVFGKARFKI